MCFYVHIVPEDDENPSRRTMAFRPVSHMPQVRFSSSDSATDSVGGAEAAAAASRAAQKQACIEMDIDTDYTWPEPSPYGPISYRKSSQKSGFESHIYKNVGELCDRDCSVFSFPERNSAINCGSPGSNNVAHTYYHY